MPRLDSRRSDSSDVEVDGLAEQELLRLQQEYRVMEGDRKAYSEESQNILRKQRYTIASLQSENEELSKESRLAGSLGNQGKDDKNTVILNDLLQIEDGIKLEMNIVNQTITELTTNITDTEKKIRSQRKNMGGVHMSKDKHIQTQKHLRVLENRLDQGNTKFNKGLASNADLRQAIDHMRTERLIFEGLYKKLEKKLNENKEEIAQVIEASTSAYDARDDAQSKMIALKEKSDKDLMQYNMELKELMRVIDHDRKLKEFMGAKGEDRAEMLGLSLQLSSRKGDEKDKAGDKEDTITSYETAFEKIKQTTDIEDLDLLVDKFIETEDRNFALFNYVNELNNEIELLHEQMQDVQEAIEKFNEESNDLEEQRKEIIASLKEREEKAGDEADSSEDQCKLAMKILDSLKLGTVSLFNKVACDPSPIVEMLGGHAGITEGNMMQYLGIIEQRTNEMLQVQAFMGAKDEDKAEVAESVGLLGKGPMAVPSVATIQPPVTADDYDSDFSAGSDDENRPLTQTELRAKIVKGITKREQGTPRVKEKDRPNASQSALDRVKEEGGGGGASSRRSSKTPKKIVLNK